MTVLEDVDALIARGGRFAPRWGWHDDHREVDGTPAYQPALQQVHGEFAELLGVLSNELNGGRPGKIPGACLQLGIGECDASHHVWREVFSHVMTLDWREVVADDEILFRPGVEIASSEAIYIANTHSPYDFLFIDAGHSFDDARRDHQNYGFLVRSGGIIVFHDALRRPGFNEVEVWRYLETLTDTVRVIGHEVGVAWLRVL